jgi:hypothetical protein
MKQYMKKQFLIITALLLCQIIQAQRNPIDVLFDKYSEREGFTYVSISGSMLNLIGSLDAENNPDNLMLRLSSIKILSQNDSLSTGDIDLYEELSKKHDLSVYEELMIVKEGSDITKFLIKQKGNTISELLVISRGQAGSSIISILGDINLNDLSKLSDEIGIEELEELEGIEDEY